MTDSEKAKRAEKARRGRWAIARVQANTFHVMNLDNPASLGRRTKGGGHTYTVTIADGDAYTCTCRDFVHRGGPCKHSEAVRLLQAGTTLDVQPLVETGEDGVHLTFADGACISLTIGGRSACTLCGPQPCSHFRAALPFYEHWLEEQAATGRWPERRLRELGVGQSSRQVQSHQSNQQKEAQMSESKVPDWAEVQRALAEPFPAAAISWKAQAVSKSGDRALAVAYIDARDVMDRLDEAVGPQGWSDSYRVVTVAGESAVECTLTVLGVSKTDVGTPGDSADRAKGAYSDAFKRAAVRFGIGRYLYRLPKAWVGYDPVRRQLAETPSLPAWALPGNGRPQALVLPTPSDRNGGNGMSIEQARKFRMPFGTKNHPEFQGQALGSLPADLIAWLAGDSFQPDTGAGRQVKAAAEVLAETLVAA